MVKCSQNDNFIAMMWVGHRDIDSFNNKDIRCVYSEYVRDVGYYSDVIDLYDFTEIVKNMMNVIISTVYNEGTGTNDPMFVK